MRFRALHRDLSVCHKHEPHQRSALKLQGEQLQQLELLLEQCQPFVPKRQFEPNQRNVLRLQFEQCQQFAPKHRPEQYQPPELQFVLNQQLKLNHQLALGQLAVPENRFALHQPLKLSVQFVQCQRVELCHRLHQPTSHPHYELQLRHPTHIFRLIRQQELLGRQLNHPTPTCQFSHQPQPLQGHVQLRPSHTPPNQTLIFRLQKK